MDLKLPFTSDTINGLVGKTVVLSENHYNDHTFNSYLTFKVQSGGDSEVGYFEVEDGNLRQMTPQGLLCEFSGVEHRNGVVYAVGMSAGMVLKNGYNRLTMHERVPLKIGDFGICISSHVNYAKDTLPVLLDSLRKSGFDMTKVVVSVGGFNGSKTEEMEGAKIVYGDVNGMGFGGLLVANSGFEYWMLLHDTCEAERTFVENFTDVDVGLSPDVVRMRDDMDDWTGFYKYSFIEKIRGEIISDPCSVRDKIDNMANVVTVVAGKASSRGIKDVYGKGNKRIIDVLPVGIRKYRGVRRRNIP